MRRSAMLAFLALFPMAPALAWPPSREAHSPCRGVLLRPEDDVGGGEADAAEDRGGVAASAEDGRPGEEVPSYFILPCVCLGKRNCRYQ